MYKDIMVQKGILFLAIFYVLMPCFIDNNTYESNLFVVMNMMIASEIVFANIAYFYLEEKSSGDLLLTTTSYTRKDIVISKYLFLILIASMQLLISYSIAYMNLGLKIINVKSLYDFILNILFLNITVALITPICFLKFGALTKTIFACMIWSSSECLPMIIDFGNYIYPMNLGQTILLSILLSAVLIYISIFISNKIFKGRNF